MRLALIGNYCLRFFSYLPHPLRFADPRHFAVNQMIPIGTEMLRCIFSSLVLLVSNGRPSSVGYPAAFAIDNDVVDTWTAVDRVCKAWYVAAASATMGLYIVRIGRDE
jgi:hypothetical protein